MAHIIKKAAKYLKIQCQDCFVTVAYVPKEVQRIDGRDCSGGPDGYKYIVCPGCNEHIILERW